MGAMTTHRDHSIDDLLAALPPAPAAWTRRAEELPLLGRALELLEERCPSPDLAAGRQQIDAALREVGLEPDEQRAEVLRRLHGLRRGR